MAAEDIMPCGGELLTPRGALVRKANRSRDSWDASKRFSANPRPGPPVLTEASSRGTLLEWLAWNDPSCRFYDEEMEREGFDPMTLEDAWEQLALTLD
jgi:hypothetical protein